MNVSLIIKCICLLASTFAVSGINFDHFVKSNHIWETRFLAILFILGLAYMSSSMLINLIN